MRTALGPANNLDAKAPSEEDKPAAEKQSKYFLSVRRSLQESPAWNPSLWGMGQKMCLKSGVSVDEVIKQLDKINGNSSVVPDGIQSRALKEFKDEIAKLLTVLSLL